MKIVQGIGWYFPDSVGGTEIYVEALAALLRDAGHEVTVAVPEPGARGPRVDEWNGVPVFRYPLHARPTRDEAQGRTPAAGAELFHEWMNATAPDVVHLHTFVTGLGLAEIAAARCAGAQVVVTTHSSSLGFLCQRGTLMLRGETLCDGRVQPARCAACELEHRGAGRLSAALAAVPASAGRLARAIPGPAGTALGMQALIGHNLARQREMFRLVDHFVVLTARAADIVVNNGAPASKVSVNRLGVSSAPALDVEPRTGGTGLRLGYVGRFDPVKGVFDLAEALVRLPPDLPIRCEFRGPVNTPSDRDVRAALEQMFSNDPRVTIAEPVTPAQVRELMPSYDLLVCPSRCLEGGPTAALEAMACGTPVLAADAGGVAEVIEDGTSGRLVPPGDVRALSAAILEVARAPQLVDRWRAALPSARTMREVAADYLELYAARPVPAGAV
jgi:glycosyltransferase involved in cell wall biosynthesis